MSNPAIAHRLGVSEKAIRKLVGPSKPAAGAQLALAGITTAAVGRPLAAGAPSAPSRGDDAAGAVPSAEDCAGDRDPVPAPGDDMEPVAMSLTATPAIGPSIGNSPIWGCLMMALLFREGSAGPGVGVLLAVPCLVDSGLLRTSRKLYGEIGPAFYGLRTTLLTLLFMALLRITRPDHLKERDPAACGTPWARPSAGSEDVAAPTEFKLDQEQRKRLGGARAGLVVCSDHRSRRPEATEAASTAALAGRQAKNI